MSLCAVGHDWMDVTSLFWQGTFYDSRSLNKTTDGYQSSGNAVGQLGRQIQTWVSISAEFKEETQQ